MPRGLSLPGLGTATEQLAEALVRRAIAFVQSELPGLAEAVDLSACTAESRLTYSEGEPALNVYSAPGGDFQPHQDMKSLTLLLNLSSLGAEYEGGGTAFFAPDASLPAARRGTIAPIALLRPAAGTALLWGGSLLHAGAAVTTGRRLVFVASFTRAGE